MKKIALLMAALFTLTIPATTFAALRNAPVQNAKTVTIVYTNAKDIAPNTFTVKKGERVRLEINPTDTGSGCMSTIMVPGLWDKAQPLVKGKKIVMEFTPQRSGSYKITCNMGVPRGMINVR